MLEKSHNSFGQKLISDKGDGVAPGPGAYNLRTAVGAEGVKSTMVGRRPETTGGYTSYIPGPGAYSPTNPRGGVPSYKVGTALRGQLNSESKLMPGPGAYNPADRVAKVAAPGWG